MLLAGIGVAQRAGFKVEEIKQLFYGFPADASPSERWSELARSKLVEIEQLIDRAQGMKRLLEEGIRCGCSGLDECELVQKPTEIVTESRDSFPGTISFRPPGSLQADS